jgi:hypothetical protein
VLGPRNSSRSALRRAERGPICRACYRPKELPPPHLLSRVNTGGAELSTFCARKMRASRLNKGSFRMSSRQFQLSRYEEKGKALGVARTAGSADAFPVHRERHHEGMEIRNRETKSGTLRRLKKRGHIQFDTGNTTQIHKCKVNAPCRLCSQQSCQLSSQLCS